MPAAGRGPCGPAHSPGRWSGLCGSGWQGSRQLPPWCPLGDAGCSQAQAAAGEAENGGTGQHTGHGTALLLSPHSPAGSPSVTAQTPAHARAARATESEGSPPQPRSPAPQRGPGAGGRPAWQSTLPVRPERSACAKRQDGMRRQGPARWHTTNSSGQPDPEVRWRTRTASAAPRCPRHICWPAARPAHPWVPIPGTRTHLHSPAAARGAGARVSSRVPACTLPAWQSCCPRAQRPAAALCAGGRNNFRHPALRPSSPPGMLRGY